MKRKLFFFLEKLEIKRSERIATSVLMTILVLISGLWTIIQPRTHYDEENYRELEKIFRERSETLRQDQDLILARYEPGPNSEIKIPVSASVREESNAAINVTDTTSQNEEEEEEQPQGSLNINAATIEQLQTLPGIGPAYARRIIEWRNENGNFTIKDQLLEIKGIGEKRLAKIKPLITL